MTLVALKCGACWVTRLGWSWIFSALLLSCTGWSSHGEPATPKPDGGDEHSNAGVRVEPSDEPQRVALGDGQPVVYVPAGALDRAVTLSVEPVDIGETQSAATQDGRKVSGAVVLVPDGLELAAPVVIELPIEMPADFTAPDEGGVRVFPLPAYWRRDADSPWEPEDLHTTSTENDGVAMLVIDAKDGQPHARVLLTVDHFSTHGYVVPAVGLDPSFGWGEMFNVRMADGAPLLIPSAILTDDIGHLQTLRYVEVRRRNYYDLLRELMLQTTRQREKLWGNLSVVLASLRDDQCPGCTSREQIQKELKALREEAERATRALKLVKRAKKLRKFLDALNGVQGGLAKLAEKAESDPSDTTLKRLKMTWDCLKGGVLEVGLYSTLDAALTEARWDAITPQVLSSPLYRDDPAYRSAVADFNARYMGDGAFDMGFASQVVAFLDGTRTSCSALAQKVILGSASKAVADAVIKAAGGTGAAATAFTLAAAYLVADFAKDSFSALKLAERLSGLGSLMFLGGVRLQPHSPSVSYTASDGTLTFQLPDRVDQDDSVFDDALRLQAGAYGAQEIAKTTKKMIVEELKLFVIDPATGKERSIQMASGSWVTSIFKSVSDVGLEAFGHGRITRYDLANVFDQRSKQYGVVLGALDRSLGDCGVYPCDFACVDLDGDGYGEGAGCLDGDCDDTNATVHASLSCDDLGLLCAQAEDGCGGALDCTAGCDTCADSCESVDKLRCEAGQLEQCRARASGCRVWVAISECAAGCNAAATACEACANTCSTLDSTRCTDGRIEVCTLGTNGCATWGASIPCGSGFCADATTCGQCNNECAFEGLTECIAGEIRTCRAVSNGCLTWSGWNVCPESWCEDATTCGACLHECPLVDVSCKADGVTKETCATDGNGCRKLTAEACAVECLAGECTTPSVAVAEVSSPTRCETIAMTDFANLNFGIPDLTGIDSLSVGLRETTGCDVEPTDGSVSASSVTLDPATATATVLNGLRADTWYKYTIESVGASGYASSAVSGWFRTAAPCLPTTCDTAGWNCGTADDGCGTPLDCGTCTSPETCAGSGISNICGALGVGAWTKISNAVFFRYSHATVAVSDHLYVLGGHAGSGFSTQYLDTVVGAPINGDGGLGTPFEVTSLPTARHSLGAAAYDGRIYVVGGNTGMGSLNSVLVADVNADGTLGAWTATTPLPTPMLTSMGVAVFSNRLYVVGGTGLSSQPMASVFFAPIQSDGTLGSWTTSTALPSARTSVSAVAWDGYLYALGGYNYTLGGTLTEVLVAPIAADGSVGQWSGVASLPAPRAMHAAVAVHGAVYVMGGEQASDPASAKVVVAPFQHDGSLGAWTETTALPGTREGSSATSYGDSLYVTGGDGCSPCGAQSNALYAGF